MSDEPRFVCQNCGVENELSDLKEVEEEKEKHSHFECPNCGGEQFTRLPKDNDE